MGAWPPSIFPSIGGRCALNRCILFILNSRGYGYEYGCDCGGCGACLACNSPGDGGYNSGLPWINNSGLFNSCAFIVDMLNASGVPARLTQINDPLEIDNKVGAANPSAVVLEAIFVPPTTLAALVTKHPLVRWIVRLHSEIPFLVQEGRALSWIYSYLLLSNVSIAANTARARGDLQIIAKGYFPHWDTPTLDHRIELLPNYYPAPAPLPHIPSPFGLLNIGCLGALRPLKNQVLQAVAAVALAADLGKQLAFHINTARVEGGVPSILTNLRSLFRNIPNAALVEHEWLSRDDFFDLCRRMDLGMQVSLSETYNIVSADFATNNIPVLVSPEIVWADSRVQAKPTHTTDMVAKGKIALRAVSITESNRRGLLRYNDLSRQNWLSVFGGRSPAWTDRPNATARAAITSVNTHME